MSERYRLDVDGKTPIPCPDLMAWAKWLETSPRIVQRDIVGDVRVSTVFLGLDYSFGDGPPLLWETMIFGGEHDQYQDRYSSHADALVGHARALLMVANPATNADA